MPSSHLEKSQPFQRGLLAANDAERWTGREKTNMTNIHRNIYLYVYVLVFWWETFRRGKTDAQQSIEIVMVLFAVLFAEENPSGCCDLLHLGA